MQTFPDIQHHGGADGVTGSCHRLRLAPDRALLIDCGLFQGQDADRVDSFEQHRVRFPVDDLLALVVTHVHIDHIGRLPYLLAAGYQGPIICSVPSAHLLPLVIEDALKIGFTRDAALIERFLSEVRARLVPLEYRVWHTVVDDARHRLRVRLQRAGHILGSAYIECDVHDRERDHHERIVFSGDLGAPYAPLLPAPRSPFRADRVVLESTYGDRRHEDRRSRRARLKAAIERALANDGTVIIPAFSIGRTQELLYELESLIHQAQIPALSRRSVAPGANLLQPPANRGEYPKGHKGAAPTAADPTGPAPCTWADLEIIVDSPLAARFTQVYRELKPWWDAEAHRRLRAGRHPLSFENLYTVDSHDEHLQTVDYLARTGRPAVVIAASGMAAGGRVTNYLKAMLGDPRHCVLFVGYQASGTPGAAIQRHGPGGGWVELDGERYPIRARVESIGGYSAHADAKDLINFIRRMRHWPREVRLIHGEAPAQRALKAELEQMARARGRRIEVTLARAEPEPAGPVPA